MVDVQTRVAVQALEGKGVDQTRSLPCTVATRKEAVGAFLLALTRGPDKDQMCTVLCDQPREAGVIHS